MELLSGIFLPGAVFFSKDNFIGKKETMKMFSKFARWNSLAFLGIGKEILSFSCKNVKTFVFKFIVFVGNVILLGLYIFNHLTFTCHTHPPLTKNEPCRIYESLFYVLFGKVDIYCQVTFYIEIFFQLLLQDFPGYETDAGFLWAWFFSWMLTLFHVGLTNAESCLI